MFLIEYYYSTPRIVIWSTKVMILLFSQLSNKKILHVIAQISVLYSAKS